MNKPRIYVVPDEDNCEAQLEQSLERAKHDRWIADCKMAVLANKTAARDSLAQHKVDLDNLVNAYETLHEALEWGRNTFKDTYGHRLPVKR